MSALPLSLRAHRDAAAFYYIVTELMSGGELFDKIIKKSTYTEVQARDVIASLAGALSYMHSKRIAHRDLKVS